MQMNATERERGRNECESDIQRGQLNFYWQTRGSWGEYLTTQMSKRFNVHVIHTSDMTTEAQIEFESGYNSRAKEHINSLFGDGCVQALFADVEAYRELQYRAHFGSTGQS